jgi:hypothetical protein
MTFVLQNIYFIYCFVFKQGFCFDVLMEDYKLSIAFKRGLIFDALYATRFGDVSIAEWAEEYSFAQELLFPGEREYFQMACSFLSDAKFRFNPEEKSKLVDLILKFI